MGRDQLDLVGAFDHDPGTNRGQLPQALFLDGCGAQGKMHLRHYSHSGLLRESEDVTLYKLNRARLLFIFLPAAITPGGGSYIRRRG